jgi:hypothetical protein
MQHLTRSQPSSVDPTLTPPPGYTQARADAVFGEAFRTAFEYLRGAKVVGDILEFGTFRGYTARLMAHLMVELAPLGSLYLFDSFEGLPESPSPVDRQSYEIAVNQRWRPGNLAVEPDMDERVRRAVTSILPPDRVHVVKGYFDRTLGPHVPRTKAALVHIDCDLYESARLALDELFAKDAIQDGMLLVFDDFNCNRASPYMGERRALADSFGQQQRFWTSPWFSYGWHAQVFFVHDRQAAEMVEQSGGPGQ